MSGRARALALAVVGLAAATLLGLAGYLVSRDTIALPATTLSAGEGLAPPVATTPRPAATTTGDDAPGATTTDEEEDEDDDSGRGRGRGGDSDSSGPGGGDSNSSGSGRGRGRGGDD